MKHQLWRIVLLVIVFFGGAISPAAQASPTQEDIFKSISENMGQKTDSRGFFAGMAAITALAIMVGLFSKRKQRVEKPKTLNHPGKLMKEVVRATSLRPVEVRYLKTLADRESIDSPLTLALCPSVLMRAARSGTSKAEKKVLVQLTRKLGIAMGTSGARAVGTPAGQAPLK